MSLPVSPPVSPPMSALGAQHMTARLGRRNGSRKRESKLAALRVSPQKRLDGDESASRYRRCANATLPTRPRLDDRSARVCWSGRTFETRALHFTRHECQGLAFQIGALFSIAGLRPCRIGAMQARALKLTFTAEAGSARAMGTSSSSDRLHVGRRATALTSNSRHRRSKAPLRPHQLHRDGDRSIFGVPVGISGGLSTARKARGSITE